MTKFLRGRRVVTSKPFKPGLTSFSETLALFFIQCLSFLKTKLQNRKNDSQAYKIFLNFGTFLHPFSLIWENEATGQKNGPLAYKQNWLATLLEEFTKTLSQISWPLSCLLQESRSQHCIVRVQKRRSCSGNQIILAIKVRAATINLML